MNGHDADVYDVVIVGLGPTGLTLAHGLGQRGHRVLVLEREPQFYGNARAVYTDGECMRIFQSIGMAERLAADMLQDAPVQMVLPSGEVLFQIKNTERPHGWPANNFFYQPLLETALAEGLVQYANVTVRRGRALTRFEQDAGGVDVFHAASQGSGYGRQAGDVPSPQDEQCVRARYLVGADGGRSAVRTQLGIGMTGQNFPNPWLVVDIQAKDPADGLRHLPYFNFFEFMLMPGQTREQMEHPDTVRHYLSKYIDVDKFVVLRKLVYTFNALMAERWRAGRVLLAGDAAHSYEAERKPHAAAMTREGIRMKDFVSMVNPLGTTLRNGLTRLLTRLPGIGPFICRGDFIPKPSYRNGGYLGLPRSGFRSAEGRLMPQPLLRGPDGRRQRFDDLADSGFVLVGAGCDPRETMDADSLTVWRSLGARFVAVYPFGGRPAGDAVAHAAPDGLVEAEDPDHSFHRWLRASGGGRGSVVVLRPDRFVFALVPAAQLNATTRELARQLHRAEAAPAARSHPAVAPGLAEAA